MAAAQSVTRSEARQKRIEGSNGGNTQGEKMLGYVTLRWYSTTTRKKDRVYRYRRARIDIPIDIARKLGLQEDEEVTFELYEVNENGEKMIVLRPVKR